MLRDDSKDRVMITQERQKELLNLESNADTLLYLINIGKVWIADDDKSLVIKLLTKHKTNGEPDVTIAQSDIDEMLAYTD